MKLTIILSDNPELYNLIKTTEHQVSCVLTDSLENVLAAFKNEIRNQDAKSNCLYSFDSDTQIVIDYTEKLPAASSASVFTR